MSRRVASWRIHRRVNLTLDDLAAAINLRLRGWLAYFTAFYPTAVIPLRQSHRPPSGAMGEVEVQATTAQWPSSVDVVVRGPLKGTRSVRALAVWRCALIAGRHEPYESRGSRADLWGPGGGIPPATRLVNTNAGGGAMRDGGSAECGAVEEIEVVWPSGVALRGEASNRPQLHWLKTVVMNVVGERRGSIASGMGREDERGTKVLCR